MVRVWHFEDLPHSNLDDDMAFKLLEGSGCALLGLCLRNSELTDGVPAVCRDTCSKPSTVSVTSSANTLTPNPGIAHLLFDLLRLEDPTLSRIHLIALSYKMFFHCKGLH